MRPRLDSVWLALGLAVGLAAPGLAQLGGGVQGLPGPPPRDPAATIGRTGTGAIEGVVVDAVTRDPIPRAVVQISGPLGPRGMRSVPADDRGAFALGDLPPGSFTVGASKAGYVLEVDARQTIRGTRRSMVTLRPGEKRQGVRVPLVRAGVITGRILDAAGDTVERAQVQLLRLSPRGQTGTARPREMQQTNDLGEYRFFGLTPGSYVVCASKRTFNEMADAGSRPVATCHPSSLDADQATPIALGRSETASGIDVTLVEREMIAVSGRVVGGDGEGAAKVTLSVLEERLGGTSGSSGGNWMKPDGSFLLYLAPGDYVLEATGPRMPTPKGSQAEERGAVPITVGAEPLTGVEIVMGGGGRIIGRVVFEGNTPPPANPSQVGLHLGGQLSQQSSCRVNDRPEVSADWTFVITNVWGTCRVNAWAGGGPWQLKAVLVEGTPVRDRVLSLGAGQTLRNVQVVFTDRRAGLWFEVTDEAGRATREFVALVFPARRETWSGDSPAVQSYVPPDAPALDAPSAERPTAATLPRRTRPEVTLLAGEFFVVAVDDATYEDTRDPAFLEKLAESAVKVTLAEGEHRVVPLKRVVLAEAWP